jgi:enolase-phosphatase E1
MDRDRKSPALKDLQGQIWEAGYRDGELIGQVFPMSSAALDRWRRAGIPAGIFSSGSALGAAAAVPTLLCRRSHAVREVALRTSIGSKREPSSYARIASTVGVAIDGHSLRVGRRRRA